MAGRNITVVVQKSFTFSLKLKKINLRYNYTTQCNAKCRCDVYMNFDPVFSGNTTYFSPCHAGCQQFIESNETVAEFKTR